MPGRRSLSLCCRRCGVCRRRASGLPARLGYRSAAFRSTAAAARLSLMRSACDSLHSYQAFIGYREWDSFLGQRRVFFLHSLHLNQLTSFDFLNALRLISCPPFPLFLFPLLSFLFAIFHISHRESHSRSGFVGRTYRRAHTAHLNGRVCCRQTLFSACIF